MGEEKGERGLGERGKPFLEGESLRVLEMGVCFGSYLGRWMNQEAMSPSSCLRVYHI